MSILFNGVDEITKVVDSLPPENIKKLIDNYDGLSGDLKLFLKLNMGKPEFMGKMFRGTPAVHELCSFQKYLKDPILTKNPRFSDFQGEACSILNTISNDPIVSQRDKVTMNLIMNMESNSLNNLIAIELKIAEHLNSPIVTACDGCENAVTRIAELYTFYIMPYKVKAYDITTYIMMNDALRMREIDYRHIHTLLNMINDTIKNPSDIFGRDCNDIASLLYLYFNTLGVTDVLDKYQVYLRFSLILGDDWENVYDILNNLIDHKVGVSDIVNNIRTRDRVYHHPHKSNNELAVSYNGTNIVECNGAIITMSQIGYLDSQMIDMLVQEVRDMDADEISHYIDFDPSYLTFELTENDIGHIRHEVGATIGSVVDSISKEMKHIVKYNDEMFVVFKNRLRSKVVYGVSLKYTTARKDRIRNLLEIVEDKRIQYKYFEY